MVWLVGPQQMLVWLNWDEVMMHVTLTPATIQVVGEYALPLPAAIEKRRGKTEEGEKRERGEGGSPTFWRLST